ncbi:hypothetical protein C1H46_007450 [Malus baccata]|uniref:Myb-like domain-containing protein n=1 Tax=Malus baccata TaxID=106549 RepID=A0A540N785_MALBA|nr:hypothetical protein C1H46_007450 [Malus baccata]
MASSAMKGRAWTRKEDEALCRAYRWVSEDSVRKSSQTSEGVWTLVSKKILRFLRRHHFIEYPKPRELFFKMEETYSPKFEQMASSTMKERRRTDYLTGKISSPDSIEFLLLPQNDAFHYSNIPTALDSISSGNHNSNDEGDYAVYYRVFRDLNSKP